MPICLRAISVDHLPRIDERRLILPKIDLQLLAARVLNNRRDRGLFDAPLMEVHEDSVADFELPVMGFFLAGTRGTYHTKYGTTNQLRC